VYLTNISFYLHLRAQPVSDDLAVASISSVKSHPCLGVIVTLQEMIDKLDETCPDDLKDEVETSSEDEEVIDDVETMADVEMPSEVESDVSAESLPVRISNKKRKMGSGDKKQDLMDISDIKSLLFASAAAPPSQIKSRARVAPPVVELGQPVVGSDDEEPMIKSKRRKSKSAKSQADRFSSSDSEEEEAPREFNADELEALEYYESIKSTKEKQKLDRDALYAPLPATLPEEIDEEGGGKRPASYQILSNKGLTPFRKKENRNPRVKRRNRYEKAVKKLHTVKQVAADRKTIGKYGGEMTGIKTHLARSTKL
jgi:U3 small nucleolar RNA-associated protein 3